MTENEAVKKIRYRINTASDIAGNGADGKAFEDLEMAIKAIEELKQYRAIGTVEGYEKAIQSSMEYYNLMKEYKAKVDELEAIGTSEEFKALKEKNVVKPTVLPFYGGRCTCGTAIGNKSVKYCYMCGAKFDWQ